MSYSSHREEIRTRIMTFSPLYTMTILSPLMVHKGMLTLATDLNEISYAFSLFVIMIYSEVRVRPFSDLYFLLDL
jgi:hypothetical protein